MGLQQYFWTFFSHLFITFTPPFASSLFKLGFIMIFIILSGFGLNLSVSTFFPCLLNVVLGLNLSVLAYQYTSPRDKNIFISSFKEIFVS